MVWLIGDSTVKNGTKGQHGWGDFLAGELDAARVDVKNRALGGRSSRTFATEGLWDKVAAELQPGDLVLMQFGHNDNGPLSGPKARASIKGNGEETQEVTVEATGKKETVHSYGWYLRKYAAEAKAKGATPVVLSLIPRNMWTGGKVNRSTGDFVLWATEAAKQSGAAFVDLNGIIADRYDKEGEAKVGQDYFTVADHTHTLEPGARVNAACVALGLRGLPEVWEKIGKPAARP